MAVAEHKFVVGQVVDYASGSTLPQARKSATVLKLLPELQYRIRNSSEAYDRVVGESSLEFSIGVTSTDAVSHQAGRL